MRIITAIILYLTLSLGAAAATPVFSSTSTSASKPVVEIATEPSTGLEAIYVAPTVEGLSVSADGGDASTRWLRFGASGAGYAEEIGSGSSLSNLEGGYGYIIRSGSRDTYFWLVDYSTAPMTTGTLTVEESNCDESLLSFSGEAPRIVAYAINGRPIEVDREIELAYFTLAERDGRFVQEQTTHRFAYLSSEIHTDAPLCATRFTLSPDRFQRSWGEGATIASATVQPTAVRALATATPENRENSNEQGGGDNNSAVSGPLTVDFKAEITDAAVFTEWQIATDPEFDNIVVRDQNLSFSYTFGGSGSYYVRFATANADGSCEFFTDTWTTTIGESRLRCPNAFSPGASEGVNDVWRVSYRSITEFDCSIFNRWGNLIIRFTDPAEGWDGTYKGHLVEPGVYFYVIKARGADGIVYNLSGDINIVRSH